jgi:hypothetical protein
MNTEKKNQIETISASGINQLERETIVAKLIVKSNVRAGENTQQLRETILMGITR